MINIDICHTGSVTSSLVDSNWPITQAYLQHMRGLGMTFSPKPANAFPHDHVSCNFILITGSFTHTHTLGRMKSITGLNILEHLPFQLIRLFEGESLKN